MYLGLYILYAIVQAIVTTRFLRERTAPGLMVTIFIIFAPFVTLISLIAGLEHIIRWSVTVNSDK